MQAECLCELGVYGTFLRSGARAVGGVSLPGTVDGDGEEEGVLINRAAGHLLRVKPANVDEGGVAAGYAVLSSPYLVD